MGNKQRRMCIFYFFATEGGLYEERRVADLRYTPHPRGCFWQKSRASRGRGPAEPSSLTRLALWNPANHRHDCILGQAELAADLPIGQALSVHLEDACSVLIGWPIPGAPAQVGAALAALTKLVRDPTLRVRSE